MILVTHRVLQSVKDLGLQLRATGLPGSQMISKNRGDWGMGGDGSGKRGDARPTTDEALALDVRRLVRQGLIKPGGAISVPLRWGDDAALLGQVRVGYDGVRRPDELVLDYRLVDGAGSAGRAVHEVLALERTPCPYGGERVWVRCPGCEQRKAVLYLWGERFHCVRCHDLAYASTRQSRLRRLHQHSHLIHARLGAEYLGIASWVVPPPKPRGMHWRTYWRLRRELETVHAEILGLPKGALTRLRRQTG
jgi:hypothetical protein